MDEEIPDYQIFWVDKAIENEDGELETIHYFEVYDNHQEIVLGEFTDYQDAEDFAEAWLVEKGY